MAGMKKGTKVVRWTDALNIALDRAVKMHRTPRGTDWDAVANDPALRALGKTGEQLKGRFYTNGLSAGIGLPAQEPTVSPAPPPTFDPLNYCPNCGCSLRALNEARAALALLPGGRR